MIGCGGEELGQLGGELLVGKFDVCGFGVGEEGGEEGLLGKLG